MAGLPPVFVEFLGKSTGIKTALRDIKAETSGAAIEGETAFSRFGRVSRAAVMGIGIAAAGAAVGAVKMASDFQTQMTRVQTGAGESQKNIKAVGDGILAMAGEVGQSTSQLTTGLYTVESAGYHGADALTVLKNSAEGAKVGAADLGTVTDAVTTALNAYKLGASSATEVTNALIGTEAEGKTNMEALAGSMATILPAAATAHVGLNEVLGAMATMTAQGTPAKQAATYLRQTILQLSNPTAKAADEMKNLGLSSIKVSQELGKKGLAATLTTLTDAIKNKMGPAGTVLIKRLQGAAKHSSAFQKVLADLPPSQQTFIGALADMVGGTKSMQAALELTGPHMKDFKEKTKAISEHVKKGGKNIEGWSAVQKTLNQKLAEAKGALQGLTIQVGQSLLPAATKLMGIIAKTVTWLTKHKNVAKALAIVIGVALVAAIVAVTMAMWAWVTSAEVLEAIPIVLIITAIIVIIILLATHWKQVWKFVKDVALDVWHFLEGVWSGIKSGLKTAWGAIVGAIKTAWKAVAGFFVSAWHTVTDPIVKAWDWVKKTTTRVWDAIKAFFKKWWPLLLVIFATPIALLIATWNHFHKQIMHVVHAVWNNIKEFFKATWDGIKVAAKDVWGGIKVTIIKPMETLWGWLKSLWKTVSGWLSSAWHGIKHVASQVWASIKKAMVDPLISVWHSITGYMDKIKDAIFSKLLKAWDTVKSVGSWFKSIGSAIVEGIVNGVESAAGDLFGSLKNLASNALSSAKSFLGINSPSKVFANVVGMAIPEGIAKGVDDHAHLAHRSVANLSQRLAQRRADLGSVMLETGAHSAPGAAHGGSQGVPLQQEIYFQIDGETLFKGVQKATLQYNRRNRSNGLSLAH